MLLLRLIERELFLLLSRPVFRFCEIICNHAARVFAGSANLSREDPRLCLEDLNRQRIGFQSDLNRIGSSHSHMCAECKGHCCGGVRERDAFIDRILQDPYTPHRGARRRTSGAPAATPSAEQQGRVAVLEAECVQGHCTELTARGCHIPYEFRPIQCSVYFCRRAVDQLSREERRTGASAVIGLMGVQICAVVLLLQARVKAAVFAARTDV